MEFAFGIIGLALLAGGLLLAYLAAQTSDPLRATGIRVRGVVVRNRLQLGHAVIFRPVVRFTTQEGQLVEAEYARGLASAVPQFSVGRTVWLAYNPGNYADFLILSS